MISCSLEEQRRDILAQSQKLEEIQTWVLECLKGKPADPTPANVLHGQVQPTESTVNHHQEYSEWQFTTGCQGILSRIIRAELRQQLKPISDRLADVSGLIDGIAVASATHSTQSAPIFSQVGKQLSRIEVRPVNPTQPSNADPGRSREVVLSTTRYRVDARLAYIYIGLDAYRCKDSLHSVSKQYFRLAILIIPRPHLCSRGISLLASSGPKACGHYEICPSILPMRVVEDWDTWVFPKACERDDVSEFRKLLSTGEVTLRDVTDFGANILDVCLLASRPHQQKSLTPN